MKIKVLYITSLSHSGSTLLDLLLNGHSQIFSVGEIKQLSTKWKNLNRNLELKDILFKCCCGQDLITCDFWARVNQRVQVVLGKSLASLNTKGSFPNNFVTDNEILFRIISETAETPFIVDSSKDIRRLKLLQNVPGIEVFPVILARDPKGQICSIKTKARRKGRRGESITSSIVRYNETNRNIKNTVNKNNHVQVQYELLVAHPEETLRTILQPLGLNFEPQQLKWAEHERHLVAGNRMRWQTTSEIRADAKWKQHLTFLERTYIDLGTLSSRYPSLSMFDLPLKGLAKSLSALNRISSRK